MPGPAADPPISFSTFVISLASSALAQLGHVDEAHRHGIQVDLNLARQSIDLIDMLKEKTKGNLDDEERQLLDAVQRELHEKYDAASRGRAATS